MFEILNLTQFILSNNHVNYHNHIQIHPKLQIDELRLLTMIIHKIKFFPNSIRILIQVHLCKMFPSRNSKIVHSKAHFFSKISKLKLELEPLQKSLFFITFKM